MPAGVDLVFDNKERGHSWTRNFWTTMVEAVLFTGAGTVKDGSGGFGAGYLTAKYIDGTYVTAGAILYGPYQYVSGGAATTNGIYIGTDDMAFSGLQYDLVAPIANGSGAGQFNYLANSAVTKSYSSNIWKFTMSRIMNNNSGESITVKEVGLLANTLQERSVLSPTVAVANGAQLTVTYEISMDFSAIDS